MVNPGLSFLGHFRPRIAEVQTAEPSGTKNHPKQPLTSCHSTLGYAFLATSGHRLETSKLQSLRRMFGAKHIRVRGGASPYPAFGWAQDFDRRPILERNDCR
jgi:hypothetical protein